jgi:hypothetical protein
MVDESAADVARTSIVRSVAKEFGDPAATAAVQALALGLDVSTMLDLAIVILDGLSSSLASAGVAVDLQTQQQLEALKARLADHNAAVEEMTRAAP